MGNIIDRCASLVRNLSQRTIVIEASHCSKLTGVDIWRIALSNQRVSVSGVANNQYFNEAREKLEKWADDLVLAAEKALKDTKEQIKIFERQARLATNLDEQHEIQQKIQKLEKQKRRQRQEIFQVEDSIIEKRDALIDSLERRLTQKTESESLFTIEWAVI